MTDSPLCITLDIDWSPDHVIDDVANDLIQAGVKATWFVTHDSPAVDRLRKYPELFELGIHPNFFPGSTHGTEVSDVLAFCMALVPQARCMRTHGLLCSTRLFDQVLDETPIERDVSTLLFRAQQAPITAHVHQGKALWRIPFVWEDDIEARLDSPQWSLENLEMESGPQIVAFHPLLIALNDFNGTHYSQLRRKRPHLPDVTVEEVAQLHNKGEGSGRLFKSFLKASTTRERSTTISALPCSC